MIDTTKNTRMYTTFGIKSATPLKTGVAAKLISKAKRPLLIVGAGILEDELLKRALSMSVLGIPIAATGDSLKGFVEAEVDASYVNLHSIAQFMADPDWPGLDGCGSYDLAIFLGHKKYYVNQVLSGFKNFIPIKTMAIDRHYIQNANMSFGNLSVKDHLQALDELIESIEVKE
ncbi:MAG: CO dehydrogenase/acetyl-CoA synthase complex subunit epsilon [Candidatus Methanogaster sp.]|uniref:CO dehydrogenase/acetyl-CoA synthase complex subunit epsilon n=1 Tax=Candidatus Methanogaster sp. TaxID=3386292 RepID=A0AC61L6E2_9EURY|nr:MAG: CO dehydrogenase/acetyl-CoA synthase complex subunit epsilon [ANME-2 cluster archaeon]